MCRLILAAERLLDRVQLESDAQVSASLTLLPRGRGDQLVVRVVDKSGACIEIVADLGTGGIERITAIDELPGFAPVGSCDVVPEVGGPCLDVDELVTWAKKAGTDRVLEITRPLGEFIDSGSRVLCLSGTRVRKRVGAQGLVFGFDDNDELVNIEMEPELLAAATGF